MNKTWKLTAFEQKPDLIKHWICTVQLSSSIELHVQC